MEVDLLFPAVFRRSRPVSRRFLAPEQLRPFLRRAWGGRELFAEGQWQAIRVQLESEGWNGMQIELLYDQLRQGWPLSVARHNVTAMTHRCPVRARRQG